MKKFCLVLLAMIVPFLAVDLHAAAPQNGKRKAPVKKAASNTAKKTVAKTGARKPAAGNKAGASRTTNNPRGKAPVRNSNVGRANAGGGSAAEDRELALIKGEEDQMARNEVALKKGIAMIIKEVKALGSQVASMEDQVSQAVSGINNAEAGINEVEKSVALTCGANSGGQSVQGLGNGSDDFGDDGMMGDSSFDDGQGFDDGMGDDGMDDGSYDPNASF